MIAWNRVTQLEDEIGEADFAEVVTLFLEEVEEVIERLRSKIDPNSLGADLHFLKGSALNLGFQAFAELCQQGESAIRSTKGDEQAVTNVIDAYEKSRQIFLERLNQPMSQKG